VADGIELVAAYDKEPEAKLFTPKASPQAAAKTPGQKAVPSLSEIIGDDGPDSLKALLEKQHGGNNGVASPAQPNQPMTANAKHANEIASHLDFSEAFIDDVESQHLAQDEGRATTFPDHQASSIDESPVSQPAELAQLKKS